MRTVHPLAMTAAPPAHVWTLRCCAGRDAHRLAAVMAVRAVKSASLI